MQVYAGMQEKQWIIRPADARAGQLAESLKIAPLLAQVLINRGVTDSQTGNIFLRPKLTELIGPEKMPGINGAVARIKQAIRDKEKITLYGDYDVDGITGVSILLQILRLLNANVDCYIPHRINEGYGLNEEAIRSLAKVGTRLLITIDCGVTAINSASLAKQLGIDLIITDHHQFDRQLPEAVAIVHPAMEQSYDNQDSSGSMVAYKLAWAVANEFSAGRKLGPKLRDFMITATSLAAMGTVADIVDLRGENRILTSYGLKSLPKCNLCGVQALIESAGLTGQGLDSFHIGFRLAPMLNAAGRMGHARLAVELLTNDNPTRSVRIAEYLKDQNDQRRRCEQKILKQAREMILQQGLNHPDRRTIVLASDNWHTGVIGIVASRIVDKYYRPTVMINTARSRSAKGSQDNASDNSIAHGSARSVAGFDIVTAISACSQHLIDFGGHKMAAGITIETEKIDRFTADFEAYARQNLTEDDVVAKLHIDAEAALSQFHRATVTQLQMLSPFGAGNPRPVFATKGVRLASVPRRVGTGGKHLQLAITDNTASIRCIGFRFGELEKKLLEHEFFNVAYQPQLNNYNGTSNVEFVLSDIQFE